MDWSLYKPGYCLTSPPTFAQIRKINKITGVPALPCANNTFTKNTEDCTKLIWVNPSSSFILNREKTVKHIGEEQKRQHGQRERSGQHPYGSTAW